MKMIKLAFYGKGGIGKSTTASNLSLAFREMGLNVLQVGCDPKEDSTLLLRNGKTLPSVLDVLKVKDPDAITLDELVIKGVGGVMLAEAGGPPPGLGCAGRSIVVALNELKRQNVFEEYKIDVVIYDVLGDVVCGGFSMPIREGFAEDVFIVTSGENMALHAARNISLAVDNFKDRGYAHLGGVILNKRNVDKEEEKVEQLCKDIASPLAGKLSFSKTVQRCDELEKTVMEVEPNSQMAQEYRTLAKAVINLCKKEEQC